jgi:hypothetical protein
MDLTEQNHESAMAAQLRWKPLTTEEEKGDPGELLGISHVGFLTFSGQSSVRAWRG